HGNHPSSAMFRAGASLWGCRSIKNKQTIAIAAKYPIRSAAIVISSPSVWNDAAKTDEKLCPTSHQRLREKWNYSRPTTVQGRVRDYGHNTPEVPVATGSSVPTTT